MQKVSLLLDSVGVISLVISVIMAGLAVFFYKAKNGLLRKIMVFLFGSLAWCGVGMTLIYSNQRLRGSAVSHLLALLPVLIALIFLVYYVMKYGDLGQINDNNS